MIVKGSMNYTTSGRKKKSIVANKRKKHPFVPLYDSKKEFKPAWWQKEVHKWKSAPFRPASLRNIEDTSYKKEISKQYTIAPAYNKGAYQVINPENIKDIGR